MLYKVTGHEGRNHTQLRTEIGDQVSSIVDRLGVDYYSAETGWVRYQRVRVRGAICLQSWPFLVQCESLPIIERDSIKTSYQSAAAVFEPEEVDIANH